MKRLAMEFLGAFFLTFAVGLQNPFGIGLMLLALTYIGIHISGAHYNPAVSLAKLLHNSFSATFAGYYMLAQIVGALAAVLLFHFGFGSPLSVCPPSEAVATLAIFEFLLTFLFCFVVLTMTRRSMQGDHIVGTVIGFTFVACCILNGVCNPAISIASTAFKLLSGAENVNAMNCIIVHVISPLLGAVAATYKFKWFNPGE